MKFYMIIVLSLFSYNVSAFDKYIVVSMPASGTHQLMKCVYLLYHDKYPAKESLWKNLKYRVDATAHQLYTEQKAEDYLNKGYKVFFNIRNPRDRLISCASVYKMNEKASASVQDLSLEFITGYGQYRYPGEFRDLVHNFADQYKYYLPWLNFPGVLVVKFEDLIGPKGGGDLEKQKNEIKRIAKFLDIPLTERKLNFVINHLWGKTQSFRNPVIGKWKRYFTDVHYEAYKRIGMEEVEKKLGYIN